MALSDEEKQLLAQLEASLEESDPKLASALRGTSGRKSYRRRVTLAGLAFLVGVTALVAGLRISPVISVVGFLLMLTGTVVAVSAWPHVGSGSVEEKKPSGGGHSRDFMGKMEERWRRRQDEGF